MNRFAGRTWVTVASLAIVLAMTHVADAQRQGGGRGGRGGGFGRGGGGGLTLVDLAQAEEVQAALGLTDEQKEQVSTINDDFRQGRRDLFRAGGEPGEMQEEMQKLNQDTATKLAEALDETQNKRLLGILAQVDVDAALNNDAIVKELSITDEQKEGLTEARDANRQAMRDARDEMQDLTREERTAKMDELRADANKKLLAALTSDQQSQFEALKGEPVEIDMAQFRMGGGRGGRGGGGGFGGGRGNRGGDRDGGAEADNDQGT